MSICDTEIESVCDECYEVSRSDSDLTFIYGLTPTTQYYLWVVDKFRNSYWKLITSGADGSFTIDPSDGTYPNGMFNQYAGDFEVFISSDLAGENRVNLTIYATTYTCVVLTITSSSEIDCDPYDPSPCDPAIVTDGANAVAVASGGVYTCGDVTTFRMIINQNGVEIYNQIWSPNDTNIININ